MEGLEKWRRCKNASWTRSPIIDNTLVSLSKEYIASKRNSYRKVSTTLLRLGITITLFSTKPVSPSMIHFSSIERQVAWVRRVRLWMSWDVYVSSEIQELERTHDLKGWLENKWNKRERETFVYTTHMILCLQSFAYPLSNNSSYLGVWELRRMSQRQKVRQQVKMKNAMKNEEETVLQKWLYHNNIKIRHINQFSIFYEQEEGFKT